MEENNSHYGLRWAHAALEETAEDGGSMSMHQPLGDYYKGLLEEAAEYISRLEQSVEFWKKQHKEACEDYTYWKELYENLRGDVAYQNGHK